MITRDVPTNWRRWTGWIAGSGQPGPKDGVAPIMVPETSILVSDPFCVIEMREWLRDNTRSGVAYFGRWNLTEYAYRIDRKLVGLNLVFEDHDEAFHAKFRWF